MSNPLSNLKKSRKTPLPAVQTGVPYRNAAGLTDENKLLEAIIRKDVMTSLNDEEIKAHRDAGKTPRDAGKTPRDEGKRPPGPSIAPAPAPSDNDLMTVMMSRLTQLEKQVHLQTRQIIDKDKKIDTLERKLSLLRKSNGADNPAHVQQLEQKCLQLQEQILDMEMFLADYGMMWVGDRSLSSTDSTSGEDFPTDRGQSGKKLWSQGSSHVKKGANFHVDYNLVIRNIEELNILAGEGVAKIQQTPDGARLKMPDPVPLTLYANGIVMFAGPFRSFDELVTQRCLGDLMDGYFPSELQERFPDGVPFQVTDKRSVEFVDRLSQIFEGRGELLGGETKPSRLVPTNLTDSERGRAGAVTQETTQHLPGPKLSMEQFLSKVPQSVIKQGRVVDIRQSLHNTLQSSDSSTPEVIIVDTPCVVEMRERLKVDPKDRPVSSRQLTTLRIKNETGNHTYILKMRFSDTIKDVRLCLDAERSGSSMDYEIISTFPRHTYSDDTQTLEDCHLTPSATLLLKPKTK